MLAGKMKPYVPYKMRGMNDALLVVITGYKEEVITGDLLFSDNDNYQIYTQTSYNPSKPAYYCEYTGIVRIQ